MQETIANRLEPQTEALNAQERIMASIAISLKRIADAIDNNTLGDGIYNAITAAGMGLRR